MELKHHDTYSEILFYMIHRISFLHDRLTEKSSVHVYISPFLFLTVNDNTKHTSKWSYKNRNTTRTDLGMPIAPAVIAVKDERHCTVTPDTISLPACVWHEALLAATGMFLAWFVLQGTPSISQEFLSHETSYPACRDLSDYCINKNIIFVLYSSSQVPCGQRYRSWTHTDFDTGFETQSMHVWTSAFSVMFSPAYVEVCDRSNPIVHNNDIH